MTNLKRFSSTVSGFWRAKHDLYLGFDLILQLLSRPDQSLKDRQSACPVTAASASKPRFDC